MTIEILEGDLLDAFDAGEVSLIAHCVNCQGVMGSGIAKQIRARYPFVYTRYKEWVDLHAAENVLGQAQIVFPDVGKSEMAAIFNLFGQDKYGKDGKRYLNYGAISNALKDMSKYCDSRTDVIGFPYNIGCGLAGGDWNIVLEMIDFYFKDYRVEIYKL